MIKKVTCVIKNKNGGITHLKVDGILCKKEEIITKIKSGGVKFFTYNGNVKGSEIHCVPKNKPTFLTTHPNDITKDNLAELTDC